MTFHYQDADHSYWLGDRRIPSVTQLLDLGQLVTAKDYYTEASRQRGQIVHALTADHDLGVLDVPEAVQPFRGYALAYIAAKKQLRPAWDAIEVAECHPGYRFGGRPDRVGLVFKRRTVLEIKSAAKAKHHAIQTALQAILLSCRWQLPPQEWQRLTLYLKDNGKFSMDEHTDRRDFDTAFRLIKEHC